MASSAVTEDLGSSSVTLVNGLDEPAEQKWPAAALVFEVYGGEATGQPLAHVTVSIEGANRAWETSAYLRTIRDSLNRDGAVGPGQLCRVPIMRCTHAAVRVLALYLELQLDEAKDTLVKDIATVTAVLDLAHRLDLGGFGPFASQPDIITSTLLASHVHGDWQATHVAALVQTAYDLQRTAAWAAAVIPVCRKELSRMSCTNAFDLHQQLRKLWAKRPELVAAVLTPVLEVVVDTITEQQAIETKTLEAKRAHERDLVLQRIECEVHRDFQKARAAKKDELKSHVWIPAGLNANDKFVNHWNHELHKTLPMVPSPRLREWEPPGNETYVCCEDCKPCWHGPAAQCWLCCLADWQRPGWRLWPLSWLATLVQCLLWPLQIVTLGWFCCFCAENTWSKPSRFGGHQDITHGSGGWDWCLQLVASLFTDDRTGRLLFAGLLENCPCPRRYSVRAGIQV